MGRPAIIRQIFLDSFRSVPPTAHRPDPATWPDSSITGSCLGHSTVLLNFLGTWILTDPVFSRRVGIGLGPVVIGPKRFLRPALSIADLPKLDLILLSHAHFDHLDLPSLRRLPRDTPVVTASGTADLLRHFHHVHELAWGQNVTIDDTTITAIEVNHWGARMIKDEHRGYNGYVIAKQSEKQNRRLCYAGDTAQTDAFKTLFGNGLSPDLILMPIGSYDPWIRAHCTPEQAYAMACDAGARHFVPIHHQTFKLSAEPMDEPSRRIRAAFAHHPAALLASEVGETFTVPLI